MSGSVQLDQVGTAEWIVQKTGAMRVPGRIFADRATIDDLAETERRGGEWSALRQICDVAGLPGIVNASIALPDVHPGYGFPIGGVAAFDVHDGVVAVGGVGFDINCGVRLLSTPMTRSDVEPIVDRIGEALFRDVPAGLGSEGKLRLGVREIDAVLRRGASRVVELGFGVEADLAFIEEKGALPGADPAFVSDLAKKRQFGQVGTLGSGNHYLEVQYVDAILDEAAAEAYGLQVDQVVVSIHTGSRALGHQIGQDYLKTAAAAARAQGIQVNVPELASMPIGSDVGKQYLAAMACGVNCAFANRQVIAHLVRRSLASACAVPEEGVRTVYDIGHNSAKFEEHEIGGDRRRLLVHRKGATRAFGPGRNRAPEAYRSVGHPTLVGGTMGTASYILRGTDLGMTKTFGSGVHGAGRALSRKKAAKRFWGETVIGELAERGIRVWAHSRRGVAEEAPGAYKDIERVVEAADDAGICRAVARLRPIAVIKG